MVALKAEFKPVGHLSLSLHDSEFHWDLEVTESIEVTPTVELEGSYECSVNLPAPPPWQITTVPVPINLEFTPLLSGSATAAISLEGPSATVKLGLRSKGSVVDNPTNCHGAWVFKSCDHHFGVHHTTEPVADLTIGDAKVSIKGELGLKLGFNASIGVGFKTKLATLKEGFSFDVHPIDAKLTAEASSEKVLCGTVSVGGSIAVAIRSEAWLISPTFGADDSWELYTHEVAYPGATKEIGTCPEDEP